MLKFEANIWTPLWEWQYGDCHYLWLVLFYHVLKGELTRKRMMWKVMKKYCFPLWKLKPCLLDDCSEWKTAATIGLWAQEAEQMRDGDVGQSWTMLVLYLLIQFHLFFILDRTRIFQGKKKKTKLSVSPTIDSLVWLVFQSLKPFPSEKPLGSLCAECFFSNFESDSVVHLVHLGWFFFFLILRKS